MESIPGEKIKLKKWGLWKPCHSQMYGIRKSMKPKLPEPLEMGSDMFCSKHFNISQMSIDFRYQWLGGETLQLDTALLALPGVKTSRYPCAWHLKLRFLGSFLDVPKLFTGIPVQKSCREEGLRKPNALSCKNSLVSNPPKSSQDHPHQFTLILKNHFHPRSLASSQTCKPVQSSKTSNHFNHLKGQAPKS